MTFSSVALSRCGYVCMMTSSLELVSDNAIDLFLIFNTTLSGTHTMRKNNLNGYLKQLKVALKLDVPFIESILYFCIKTKWWDSRFETYLMLFLLV